jgi:hypothetical protein
MEAYTRTSRQHDLHDPGRHYGLNYEDLTRVKARYDPGEFLHFPQSIPSRPNT